MLNPVRQLAWVVKSTFSFYVEYLRFKRVVGDRNSDNYKVLERLDGVIIKHLPTGNRIYLERY